MKSDVQTVLVVDDDPERLNFLSRALGADYPVLSASNGKDAVRRAQLACPNVIILDVMIPGGMDGFTVFSELQNDPRTRDIPVIMFTEVNRQTSLAFGADDMNRYLGKAPAVFLEKPISAERLLDAVRDVLSHAGSDKCLSYEGVPKWRDARSRPTTATVGPQLAEAIISRPHVSEEL